MSEVHRHSATGHNGPDGSVCFMEGQHHAGQLLVQEIDFVRQTAPAGQFPVRECLPSLHDLPEQKRKSAVTVLLMLQIMSGRLTGH